MAHFDRVNFGKSRMIKTQNYSNSSKFKITTSFSVVLINSKCKSKGFVCFVDWKHLQKVHIGNLTSYSPFTQSESENENKNYLWCLKIFLWSFSLSRSLSDGVNRPLAIPNSIAILRSRHTGRNQFKVQTTLPLKFKGF